MIQTSVDISKIIQIYLIILLLDSLLCLREKARPRHGLEQSVQHQHHLIILHRTLANGILDKICIVPILSTIYSCNVYTHYTQSIYLYI